MLPLAQGRHHPQIRTAGKVLDTHYRALADPAGTGVGDEGGFAPPIRTPEEALDLLVEATAAAGHTSAVHFAIDPASSEFYNADSAEYDLDFKSGSDVEHRKLNSNQLGDLYRSLLEKYPIVLLEDPFAEDDWDSWTAFMRSIKGKVELVGDDLLCTNTSIVRKAVDKEACNSMLLKVGAPLIVWKCAELIRSIKSVQSLRRSMRKRFVQICQG